MCLVYGVHIPAELCLCFPTPMSPGLMTCADCLRQCHPGRAKGTPRHHHRRISKHTSCQEGVSSREAPPVPIAIGPEPPAQPPESTPPGEKTPPARQEGLQDPRQKEQADRSACEATGTFTHLSDGVFDLGSAPPRPFIRSSIALVVQRELSKCATGTLGRDHPVPSGYHTGSSGGQKFS